MYQMVIGHRCVDGFGLESPTRTRIREGLKAIWGGPRGRKLAGVERA